MTDPPPLNILYDQGPVLVVNKPAGLLTQAPAGIDSLEVRVKEFYRRREEKEPGANIYLGLPHRLDRPVTGAIVLARHARAAQRLSAQFENRTVSKVYWAIVEGDVQPEEGTWIDHLHKRHGMSQAIVVPPDDPRGKIAIMHWRVVRRHIARPSRHGEFQATWSRDFAAPALTSFNPDQDGRAMSAAEQDGRAMCSVLEIQLETGRTHQIRVQAASRGHAVLGDAQYGSTLPFGEQFEDERLRAIALHARQLGFRHPMVDELVDVVAPLSTTWDSLAML